MSNQTTQLPVVRRRVFAEIANAVTYLGLPTPKSVCFSSVSRRSVSLGFDTRAEVGEWADHFQAVAGADLPTADGAEVIVTATAALRGWRLWFRAVESVQPTDADAVTR